MYASYMRQTLAPMIFKSLHNWSNNFFFISPITGLWAFEYIWRYKPKLGQLHHRTQLSAANHEMIRRINETSKVNTRGEVS